MIELYQVDAFTQKLFSGNPAAVCLLDEEKDAVWMQSLALEMNLSETAFIRSIGEEYSLRWFTPTTEVDLCGHATLASAWVLFSEGFHARDMSIIFHTRSGRLSARWQGDCVVLNFPAFQSIVPCKNAPLLQALGISDGRVWDIGGHLLVEMTDPEALRKLKPDFAQLKNIGKGEVAVTCLSDDEHYDFISRFFAPGCGINEDPVTGSAHCSLAPFWMQRTGKNPMRAYQASSRGGNLLVEVKNDRVDLHGHAVIVFNTKLL